MGVRGLPHDPLCLTQHHPWPFNPPQKKNLKKLPLFDPLDGMDHKNEIREGPQCIQLTSYSHIFITVELCSDDNIIIELTNQFMGFTNFQN